MALAEDYLRAQFHSVQSAGIALPQPGKSIADFIVSKTDPELYTRVDLRENLEAYTIMLCHKVQTGEIGVNVAVADALQVIAIGERKNDFFHQFIA